MVEVSADTTVTEPTAPTQPATWKEEFEKLWLQTRLGHEAFCLEKAQRAADWADKLAQFAATGDKGVLSDAGSEGEDMGVSIGNTVHNHYTSTQQSATTSPGAPATPGASSGGDSVAPGSGLPTWLKVGLAGLALAGSGGAGAAITSLLSNATTVIQQPANDTDTNSALRFKKDGA